MAEDILVLAAGATALRPTLRRAGGFAARERLKLIEASEQVLIRSGRWDFKVRSVCRQAQLSTHSFYRNFSCKDELVVALVEREVQVVADHLRRVTKSGATPGQGVWNYVHAEIGRAFDRRLHRPLSIDAINWRALMPAHPEVFERCTAALIAPLVDALAAAHESGELDCSDPVADAKMIVFLIRGMALDRPKPAGVNVREELENSVISLVSRALGLSYDCYCPPVYAARAQA
jgi:AcrR family transcriptional regulator